MLQWFLRRLSREQKGFTLIELMVVVAILAVLAFIALPRVLDALDKSKLNSGISIANEIANAMERYAAKEGENSVVSYPEAFGVSSTYQEMVDFMLAQNIASLPDATTAGKYFDVSTFTYTPDPVAAPVTDYTISVQSTSQSGVLICIHPSGVYTSDSGSC